MCKQSAAWKRPTLQYTCFARSCPRTYCFDVRGRCVVLERTTTCGFSGVRAAMKVPGHAVHVSARCRRAAFGGRAVARLIARGERPTGNGLRAGIRHAFNIILDGYGPANLARVCTDLRGTEGCTPRSARMRRQIEKRSSERTTHTKI